MIGGTDSVLTLPERIAMRLAPGLGLAVRTPPVELPGFGLSMIWHRRHDADAAHGWLRQQLVGRRVAISGGAWLAIPRGPLGFRARDDVEELGGDLLLAGVARLAPEAIEAPLDALVGLVHLA